MCTPWPGMTTQIKARVARCETCRTYERSQQKETLCSHEVPARPWAKVAADLFEFNNRSYLVTVDYHSNVWEVDRLEKTKSKDVIRKLKQHFARYGIPDTFISDNGPQFSLDEFKTFSQEWEFEHVTSSTGYAQSNGMAKSAVKSAKRLMSKAKASGTDPWLAVLDHRNTPTEGIGSSPVQRLMSKRTKTLLPTRASLLKPKTVENAKEKLHAARRKQALHYNMRAKDLPPLTSGQTVRIQPLGKRKQPWKKAQVQRKLDHISYELTTENGNSVRRNRRHLIATQEMQVEENTTASTPEDPAKKKKDGSSKVDEAASSTEGHQKQQLEMSTNPDVNKTRPGRIVKPPAYLKDYKT